MKIGFKVSKLMNILEIIDAISDWDNHTSLDIGGSYRALFGLSEEDKLFLEQFTDLRKVYDREGLDAMVAPADSLDQAISQVRKKLSSEEAEKLRSIFEHFWEKAGIMFDNNKENLFRRKKLLEEKAKEIPWEKFFSEAATFFASHSYPDQIYVHLLVNPSNGNSGGNANLGKDYLSLKPVYLGKDNLVYILSDLDILAHEAIHIVQLGGDKTKREETRAYLKSRSIDDQGLYFLNEAMTDCLAPEGILSIKYGLIDKEKVTKIISKNKEIKIRPMIAHESGKINDRAYRRDFRAKFSAQLYEAANQLLESGKSIFDDGFVKYAADCLLTIKSRF